MLRAGEPEIAVDPRNPHHLAITAFEAINTYTKPLTFAERAQAEHSSWCSLQFSGDSGNGWSNPIAAPQSYTEPANSPFNPGKVHTNTTDCMVAYGPEGRLYEGGAVFAAEPAQPGQANLGGINFPLGGDSIASSINEGRTFTKPVDPITSEDVPGLIARGLTPATNGFANPFDRPWLRVDQSNGTVYLAATGHPQYYVTASTDHGRHWRPLEALDCTQEGAPGGHEACGAYPEIGPATIEAAHGILSAAYLAGAAPGAKCPCAIFETSTDYGAHWRRSVVASGLPSGNWGIGGVLVAASPAAKGVYAVGILPPAGKALEIYTTRDSGRQWTRPAVLGELAGEHVVNRPWIAFSPQGFLGAFWRTAYPPFAPSFLQSGTQNVFVALSTDGGRSFSAPVKINSRPSPPPDPTQVAQDDVSWLAMTRTSMLSAWGDWRPVIGNPRGDLNAWFGRVPFSAGNAAHKPKHHTNPPHKPPHR